MPDNIFYLTAGLPPIDGSTTSPVNTFYLAAGLIPSDSVAQVGVILIGPLDGAIDVITPVTFTWEAVIDAIAYELQIATDSSFSNIVYDEDTLDNTTANVNLSADTTYYWRVRALLN